MKNAARRLFNMLPVAICVCYALSFASHPALAQSANIQVPQGATVDVAADTSIYSYTDWSQPSGYDPLDWAVIDPAGKTVATEATPNGWFVVGGYSPADSLEVTVPTDAPPGINYTAIDSKPFFEFNYGGSAQFDVVPSHKNWPKQIGTSGDDSASAITTDSYGNIVVAGETSGNLFGTNAGDDDAFLVKYDNTGNALWSKQFGTSSEDDISQITVDHNNNICVVGYTGGSLFGTSTGAGNAFVAQYDSSGNLLWSKQIGPNECLASSVTVDTQNNVYIVGATTGSLFGNNADTTDPTSYDGFIIKYDTHGSVVWNKQFGGQGDDIPSELSIDPQGNLYIVGSTQQLFATATGDASSFLAKFDANGNLLWGKQFGGTYKSGATSVCVNANGTVYATGYMSTFTGSIDPAQPDTPDLPVFQDGYIVKYDTNGNTLWTQQISSADQDMPRTVRLDLSGNVLVSGYTNGSLFGQNSGASDIFLAKYSASGGALLSGSQMGSGNGSQANDMCIGSDGFVYVVGNTAGNLFGTSSGRNDAFVARFNSSVQLASTSLLAKLVRSRSDAFGFQSDDLAANTQHTISFAWAGKESHLAYPSVLVEGQPYMFAGYLRYGIPGSSIRYNNKDKSIIIAGRTGEMTLKMNSLVYHINGVSRLMSSQPKIVKGHCYIPLDVIQSVLPIATNYSSSRKQIRFNPPKVTLLSMQADTLYHQAAKKNALHTAQYKSAQAHVYQAAVKVVNGPKIGGGDTND